MASRPHTDTSTSRATVPISLRMRMGIAALCWRHCDATCMTIWSARFPANKHSMHDQRSVPEFRVRVVRLWLLAAAAMILLTLIIGGATRLTVSGLSIVEWKPVEGVLPPLSEGAWQSEFEKYQTIPQYRKLNQGMSLAQFKVIYLWEWTHRLLARATGAGFLLPLRLGALAIALLVLVQIYLGALVAGLDAGLKYNTWPTIDGEYMPTLDRLFFISPLWRNLFENDLTVQFNHRMLADAICFLALVHGFDAWRARRAARGAIILAGAMTLQAALGIVTLLYEAPLALALAHQVAAMLVFTISVMHAERLSHRAIVRVPQAAGQTA